MFLHKNQFLKLNTEGLSSNQQFQNSKMKNSSFCACSVVLSMRPNDTPGTSAAQHAAHTRGSRIDGGGGRGSARHSYRLETGGPTTCPQPHLAASPPHIAHSKYEVSMELPGHYSNGFILMWLSPNCIHKKQWLDYITGFCIDVGKWLWRYFNFPDDTMKRKL